MSEEPGEFQKAEERRDVQRIVDEMLEAATSAYEGVLMINTLMIHQGPDVPDWGERNDRANEELRSAVHNGTVKDIWLRARLGDHFLCRLATDYFSSVSNTVAALMEPGQQWRYDDPRTKDIQEKLFAMTKAAKEMVG